MSSNRFSRPVVVKGWPARHCFLSLPRHWASATLPAPTPTFSLEVMQGQAVTLSWAGDMHNPSTGNENVVLVGREIMRQSSIEDGDVGVLTQVQVPPPCSTVTVEVGTLAQWQDLALNADIAQSAMLGQMRVVALGQTLPLWLEGGAVVNLTITRLEPELRCGVLQPMTQVEVLPPSENSGSCEFTPINFTPATVVSPNINENTGSDADFDDKMLEKDVTFSEEEEEKIICGSGNGKVLGIEDFRENVCTLILNYVYEKQRERKAHCELPQKSDVRLGFRVVPAPQGSDLFCDFILRHPSLVVVSRENLLFTSYRDVDSFIAKVKKINSPKDNIETSSAHRDENKSSEVKKKDGKPCDVQTPQLCTVLVWENVVDRISVSTDYVEKMNTYLKGNSCVVPDCLRRLMKLGTSSVVELCTSEVNFKIAPLAVDVLPLVPVEDSRQTLIIDSVRTMLRSLTDECAVIVNPNSLIEVNIDGKNIDVLVTTRDRAPLKLTDTSVVLLEVMLVKQHSSIPPHIHSSLRDLDKTFQAKFSFVGDSSVFSRLKQHVLIDQGFLYDCYNTVPQFALLTGSKGSGKTSLVESVMEHLSGPPYFIHSDIVRFKQLRGKKTETVEKKLQVIFREAIFRRPSFIVLDDIDHITPPQGSLDQDSGPVYEHTMQMVTMLKSLFDQVLEFFSDTDSSSFYSECHSFGSVTVVATCTARTSVHPLLVNPQGCHYFPCMFAIPPLEVESRLTALNSMLESHLKKYELRRQLISGNSSELRPQDTQNPDDVTVAGTLCSHYLQADVKMITQRTESFTLPDLNHLALRIFLQAKHRWECKAGDTRPNKVKWGGGEARRILEQIREISGDTQAACSSSSSSFYPRNTILNCDVEAALEGYTPLTLRGLTLSEKTSDTSQHVGGLAEARRMLEETLTWPSVFPNLFSKVKLRLRSGVLLYGPPGCGKTLLAHSVTANCQLNFITVKGPELLSKYIGASEEAVRDAFERASSAKPCVLFFDEFESVAPRRGHDSTGVTDRVVNQLLTQMDGVEGLTGVYILAATSRPDLIDPALLRPGRLDKCVFCPLPTVADREEILEVLGQDVEAGDDVYWTEVACAAENFTGADLQSLLSTAQVLVAQEALGDTLYEGVIASEPPQEEESQSQAKLEPVHSRSSESSDNGDLVKIDSITDVYEGEDEMPDTDALIQLNSDTQEEVIIEKEKIIYSQKRVSSQDSSIGEEMDDFEKLENSQVIRLLERAASGSVCSDDQLKNVEFKVCRRHIEAALKEVKPSVTAADRQRYEMLYTTFTKSREGNFGQPSPGKRATLA